VKESGIAKIGRLIAVASFGLLLTGMSTQFDVVVDLNTQGGPYFKLEQNKLLWGKKPVALNSLMVVAKKGRDWDYTDPLWSFALEPGDAKTVGQVRYGQVPDGFKPGMAARSLRSGQQYFVLISGAGGTGGRQFIMK